MSSDLRAATVFGIRGAVTKDADEKARAKAERLSEALRANLRRRKAAAKNNQGKSEEPAKP